MTNPAGNQDFSSGPPVAPEARSFAWRPLFIVFFSSGFLAFLTCSGGFVFGKGPSGLGTLLLYAGLLFAGICAISFVAIVVYFLVWMILKLVS